MLKKTITYKDFNDQQVTEELFFNLSKAELVELELSTEGGLGEHMQRIVKAQDGAAIMREFKKIVLLSYGEKSFDGKRFVKSDEKRREFESSEAYSTLFMEMVTNADKMAEFFNGIVPKGLEADVDKLVKRAAGQEELQYGTPRLTEKEPAQEEPKIPFESPEEEKFDGPPVRLTQGDVERMDHDELVNGLRSGKYIL